MTASSTQLEQTKNGCFIDHQMEVTAAIFFKLKSLKQFNVSIRQELISFFAVALQKIYLKFNPSTAFKNKSI